MQRIFKTPHELLSCVGEQLGVSEWLLIDQQRINQFADATGDHQWIHVDEQKAQQGPFGACIAHGYLTMSLVNYFMPKIFQVQGIAMGINYGVNKVRFPTVVPVNARVRANAELIAAEQIKESIQTIVRVTIELENSERPACIVESISRFVPAIAT